MFRVLNIEAAILFGSVARGQHGVWSDVNLLIVSDDVSTIPILERFQLAVELRTGRVDLLMYTYDEVRNMLENGNSLIVSALVEGVPLVVSRRVRELMERARRMYVRRGRIWIPRNRVEQTESQP